MAASEYGCLQLTCFSVCLCLTPPPTWSLSLAAPADLLLYLPCFRSSLVLFCSRKNGRSSTNAFPEWREEEAASAKNGMKKLGNNANL